MQSVPLSDPSSFSSTSEVLIFWHKKTGNMFSLREGAIPVFGCEKNMSPDGCFLFCSCCFFTSTPLKEMKIEVFFSIFRCSSAKLPEFGSLEQWENVFKMTQWYPMLIFVDSSIIKFSTGVPGPSDKTLKTELGIWFFLFLSPIVEAPVAPNLETWPFVLYLLHTRKVLSKILRKNSPRSVKGRSIHFHEHTFQMGRFNHQLYTYKSGSNCNYPCIKVMYRCDNPICIPSITL